EDYTQDIRVSLEILDRLADAYRRMRNTFRFLLGNLGDFDPARDRQSYARLDEVDRWVLDRLARLIGRVRRAYDEYEFHTVFHGVHNFCAVDLSALYLDIVKDRLYTSHPDDPRRRAAQTVCFDVFSVLARLMAPILTFTPEDLPGLLSAKRELLPTVFIVSRVDLGRSAARARVTYESQDIPGLVIGVDRARGEKCERCWTRSEHVGESREHPTLCERCVPVVTRLSGS